MLGRLTSCRPAVSLISIFAQAQMTLKHAQAELKTKQAEVKKMDGGYKKDQDTLKAVRSSREKLEAELAKLNYEGLSDGKRGFFETSFPCLMIQPAFAADGKEESLMEKRRQLSREVAQLKGTFDRLMSRFPSLRFEYK